MIANIIFDDKVKRFVKTFSDHKLLVLTKEVDGEARFDHFSFCHYVENEPKIDIVEKMLLYKHNLNVKSQDWHWHIFPDVKKLPENINSKCSNCREVYKRCPLKMCAYALHTVKKNGKSLDEFLELVPPVDTEGDNKVEAPPTKTYSGNTAEIIESLPALDAACIKLAAFWREFVTIDGVKDNTIKFSHVDPKLPANEFIHNEFFSEKPARVHGKLKDFEKQLNNRFCVITPQNPVVLAVYINYLCEQKDVNPDEVYWELEKTVKNSTLKEDIFCAIQRDEISNLPYSNDIKEKLIGIFNHAKKYSEGKVAHIPYNFIFYTTSSGIVEEVASLLKDIFKHYKYLPDAWIDRLPGNAIVRDSAVLKDVYDTQDPKVVIIPDGDSLTRLDETKKFSVIKRLLDFIIAKRDICTIISGEEKTLKSVVMQDSTAYNMAFNVEMMFENFSEKIVVSKICDKLREKCAVSKDFIKELETYVAVDYAENVLNDYEYIESLYRQIVANCGKTPGFDGKVTPSYLPASKRKRNLDDVLKELNGLTGLENIKREIQNLVAVLKFNNKMGGMISREKLNLHMIFTGNPGTGKTMIARLVAEIFYQLGYVKQNKLNEVEAKDLIGQYIGWTSVKTSEVIRSALDGVLFIDEAYATMGQAGTNSNFSQDFMATLIKSMEEYKERLIIIFAGYKDEMENFAKQNPGLQSRIGYRITFDDYTAEQLRQILEEKIAENGLEIAPEALAKAFEIIQKAEKVKNFGSARFVINMFQDILVNHAKNVYNVNDSNVLKLITSEDISDDILKRLGESKKSIGF